eukprot:3283025-Amphidinium_carterae.1
MLAPFFDDELWLSEELDGLDAEGDTTLGIQKVEDGDAVSLSTECLQEDLRIAGRSNCPVLTRKTSPGMAWVTRRPLAFQARGFASEQEEWD